LVGQKKKEDIPRILREHDIFVLPSVVAESGETEGLGTVLLEAMSAGLPVIGSDVGGIPDIIENGKNGLLVPERSPDKLAEALLTLVRDTALRERLVVGAQEDVRERFSWERVGKRFDALFRKHMG
jgi:glycosyltransferase involved in cell wall biosynthesis